MKKIVIYLNKNPHSTSVYFLIFCSDLLLRTYAHMTAGWITNVLNIFVYIFKWCSGKNWVEFFYCAFTGFMCSLYLYISLFHNIAFLCNRRGFYCFLDVGWMSIPSEHLALDFVCDCVYVRITLYFSLCSICYTCLATLPVFWYYYDVMFWLFGYDVIFKAFCIFFSSLSVCLFLHLTVSSVLLSICLPLSYDNLYFERILVLQRNQATFDSFMTRKVCAQSSNDSRHS